MAQPSKMLASLRRLLASRDEPVIVDRPSSAMDSEATRARGSEPAGSVTAHGLEPAPDPAILEVALEHLRQGRLQEGAVALDRAVARDPRNASLLNDLGCVWQRLGKIDEALACLASAHAQQPDNVHIAMNLGNAHLVARQWHQAASMFRRVLVQDDRTAAAWSSLGVALSEIADDQDAETACREALVIDPSSDDFAINLASVLAAQGRFEDARSELRTRLAARPEWGDGWRKIGSIAAAHGDLAAAEHAFRTGIAAGSDATATSHDLAHVLLAQGKYAEGFARFEDRFEANPAWFTDELREAARALPRQPWTRDALAGRHVLVLAEQGFGDQLMMLRYLPRLGGFGASRVTLACAPELGRLAQAVPGVSSTISIRDRQRPLDADVRVPMLSLPFYAGTTLDDIPDARCLGRPAAPAALVPSLEGLPGSKVGVAWAGNSTADDRHRKEFGLDALDALLQVPGVSFVSLQKGPAVAECHAAPWSGRMFDPMEACGDFSDTAGVMSHLDLVICVDTAVAHLGGAVGLPVWLLLKRAGEWRWGVEAATSPWYPAMRIFRQGPGEGWSRVVEQVRDALTVFVCEASGGGMKGGATGCSSAN